MIWKLWIIVSRRDIKMASVSNSLKNAPSYVQQSYKNSTTQNQSTSKSNTAKDVAKGGSVAIQQNPLKGTNYQVITNPGHLGNLHLRY